MDTDTAGDEPIDVVMLMWAAPFIEAARASGGELELAAAKAKLLGL
jgi:hypothetical protein